MDVNEDVDWELVYKHPDIRVKCLVESCETLLTAKRMSRSHLRFFAIRSGNCSHNLVDVATERIDVREDPPKLVGGGGPEGREHLWMKDRLAKIARSLGTEAVVEHTPTRADVYLPEHNLALEYQRWDTDVDARTTQRSLAGAARTLWLFPSRSDALQARRKVFEKEVFHRGGIFVTVRNMETFAVEEPWENPAQERTARLYAMGSIVEFNREHGAFTRTRRSLAKVLAQIISEELILTPATLRESNGCMARRPAWARRDQVAQAESKQLNGRLATPSTPIRRVPTVLESRAIQSLDQGRAESRSPARELATPPAVSTSPEAPATPKVPKPSSTERTPQPAVLRRPPQSGDEVDARSMLDDAAPAAAETPTPRRPWWKAVLDWLCS